MADFKRIPTTNDELDRVQQNIQDLAASIPTPRNPTLVTVAADYTLNGTEDVVHVNAQTGPVKITLLKASSANRPVTIKQINVQNGKSQVNQVTVVTPDGSPTIAGKPSIALDTTGTGSVSITSDNQQHWPSTSAGGNPPVSPTPSPTPFPVIVPGGPGTKGTGNTPIYVSQPGGAGKDFIVGLLGQPDEFSVYCAPWGSDANDGLSWYTPFLTLFRGVQAVQSAPSPSGGSINFVENTMASPFFGGGLKFTGNVDPGIGGPDWVNVTWPMRFIAHGGPEHGPEQWPSNYIAPGGGAPEFTEPVLWVACNQSITFDNVLFYTASNSSFPTVRLGLSSPLPAWNSLTTYNVDNSVIFGGVPYDCVVDNTNQTPGPLSAFWSIARANSINGDGLADTTATTNLHFNKSFFYRGGNHTAPCIDCGYTFWIYYTFCGFERLISDNSDPINQCAIRMPLTTRGGNYLQVLNQCNFICGGIYSTGGSGTITNCTMENCFYPVVAMLNEPTITPNVGGNVGDRWDLFDVNMSDTSIGENRAITNFSSGLAFATNCDRSAGRVVVTNPKIATASAMETDFVYGQAWQQLLMQQDSSRRAYSPAAAGFPNVAWQPPSSATFTTAPDGTNTAMVTDGGSNVLHIFDEGTTAVQTLNSGDRLMWGVWQIFTAGDNSSGCSIRNSGSGNITIFLGGFGPQTNQQMTLTPGQTFRWLPDSVQPLNVWAFNWGWLKVISHGTGSIQVTAATSSAGAIWRPYAAIVPAAAANISDAEVAYLVMHAQPPAVARKPGTPDTVVPPNAGSLAMWPGIPWAWWDTPTLAWMYATGLFGASGTNHAPGFVPDPGGVAGTAKFLREDATWVVPAGTGVTSVGATDPVTSTGGTTPTIGVNDFKASGASHDRGTVPDPGSSAGTSRFLREDATWVNPNSQTRNTTLPYCCEFIGTSIGTGWLKTSDSTGEFAASALEYGATFAAANAALQLTVQLNTLTVGSVITLTLTRNGSPTAISIAINGGSTTPAFTSGALASPNFNDTWGVKVTVSGTTITGGLLDFTLTLGLYQ